MTANVQPPMNPPPDPASILPGLPTVQPPSGRHILLMFVVPGTIVACLIGVMLLFTYGCSARRSSGRRALHSRRSTSGNGRCAATSAADDLAKALPRDKNLAADAGFRPRSWRTGSNEPGPQQRDPPRKHVAERLGQQKTDQALAAKELKKLRGEADFQKLERERTYIQYLTGALGTMSVPVGVPVLRQLAEQESGLEPKVLARRWRTVFALAARPDAGERLQSKYDPMPDIAKDQILRQQLQKAIDRGDRPEWARSALEHLEGRRSGKQTTMMGVDQTAVRCADPQHSDPFMRKLVALSLNFWTGSDAENERVEQLLVRLTHDSGAGTDFLIEIDSRRPTRPARQSRETASAHREG